MATAHSKIILIGEHSVVYGYPAIAIPLINVKVECIIKKACSKFWYNEKDTLSTAVYSALKYLRKENEKIKYEVKSNIPERRGMGSSAAVSIAAIRGVFEYFNKSLDEKLLEELVNKAETIAHKNPSGLDAKVCLSDKAIKFIKNVGFSYIDLDLGAYLVIADTGIYGHTREAVEKIANLGESKDKMIENLGKLTDEVEYFIKEKNIVEIGKRLTLAHNELKKLGVSIEKADILVEEAIKNGAVGAKISGGGLGGCIIALAKNKEIAENIGKKLREKGAINIWIETL